MISLMCEMFADSIADKIITFLEHPTARVRKDHLEYKDLLGFGPRNDWSEWNTLYGFAHIANHDRHYITYGGGPEGGIVKSYGAGWFAWRRNWNERIQYTRIPDALDVIYRNGDGHGAINMVMSRDNYEIGDDEYYLDDIEDDMLDWGYRIGDDESEDDEREEDESEEDESDEDEYDDMDSD